MSQFMKLHECPAVSYGDSGETSLERRIADLQVRVDVLYSCIDIIQGLLAEGYQVSATRKELAETIKTSLEAIEFFVPEPKGDSGSTI
jgi:hypothetical protein